MLACCMGRGRGVAAADGNRARRRIDNLDDTDAYCAPVALRDERSDAPEDQQRVVGVERRTECGRVSEGLDLGCAARQKYLLVFLLNFLLKKQEVQHLRRRKACLPQRRRNCASPQIKLLKIIGDPGFLSSAEIARCSFRETDRTSFNALGAALW